jgi:glycopeptide antibiotics resistance protein
LRNAVTALLLLAYGFVLSCLTLSPNTARRQRTDACLKLEPGRSIAEYLAAGGWPMVLNVLGNLAAFVPLGVLWPLLLRGRTSAWRVAGLAASVSFLIESLQFASRRRIADVDDVMLNTLGGLLGYGVYRAFAFLWDAAARGRHARSSGTGKAG